MSAIAALHPAGDPLVNIEAEAAFLGATLIDNTVVERFGRGLKPADFFEQVHARIFDRIGQLIARGQAVTPVTLKPYFEADDALRALGGVTYLARLTAGGEGLLAPGELAEQIADLAQRRRRRDWLKAQIEGAADLAQPLAEVALPDELRPRSSIAATPYAWRNPSEIPTRDWLFGRWLLRGTLACVVAPGGAGKTTFLASVALSLATGRALLGKPVWSGPARVWLWNLEDDQDELARALQASAIHHEVTESEVGARLFVDSALGGQTLCTAAIEAGEFRLHQAVFDAIARELQRRRIDCLIVDPFVSSHEVDENDNGRIDKVAKAWARVAKAAGCCIVLVHHASKAGSGEVTALSSRGAGALVNAARSTLVINRMDEAEAQRLGIAEDERRRCIRVGDDKHNRAPAESADWFRLVSIDLGNGSPGDSVAAVEAWTLPDPFDDVTVEDLRRVQARIGERRWRESSQAADWFGKLVAEELAIDLADRAGMAKAKAIIRTWIRNGSFIVEEGLDDRRKAKNFVVMGAPA